MFFHNQENKIDHCGYQSLIYLENIKIFPSIVFFSFFSIFDNFIFCLTFASLTSSFV